MGVPIFGYIFVSFETEARLGSLGGVLKKALILKIASAAFRYDLTTAITAITSKIGYREVRASIYPVKGIKESGTGGPRRRHNQIKQGNPNPDKVMS